jgi:hypothetical protein
LVDIREQRIHLGFAGKLLQQRTKRFFYVLKLLAISLEIYGPALLSRKAAQLRFFDLCDSGSSICAAVNNSWQKMRRVNTKPAVSAWRDYDILRSNRLRSSNVMARTY